MFTFRTLYMNTRLATFAIPSLLRSLLCTRPYVEKVRSTSELDATEHSKHLINLMKFLGCPWSIFYTLLGNPFYQLVQLSQNNSTQNLVDVAW